MSYGELREVYLALVGLAVVGALLPIAVDFTWGQTLNMLSADDPSTRAVWTWIIAYLLVALHKELGDHANAFLNKRLANRLETVFGEMVPTLKSELSTETLEAPAMQDSISRVAENAEGSVCQFVRRIFELSQGGLAVTMATIVLATSSWWMALVLFVSMVPAFLIEARYGRDVFDLDGELAEPRRRTEHTSWDLHCSTSLTAAKVLGAVPLMLQRIREDLKLMEDSRNQLERRYLPQVLAAHVLTFVVSSWVTITLLNDVIDGEMPLGTFTFYIATMESLRYALQSFFYELGEQLQDNRFIAETFELFAAGTASPQTVELRIDRKGPEQITLTDVGYTDPHGGKTALHGVTVIFPRGKFSVIVGPNGSGKTTLANIVAGIRQPTAGSVLIDTERLTAATAREWGTYVGLVPQDPPVFTALRIGENILCSPWNADGEAEKRATQAARDAALLPAIERLPQRFLTRPSSLFSDGHTFSGGHVQRLGWARVFAGNYRVWILDEALSMIDDPTRLHLLEKIRRACNRGVTVILVTHDEDVALRADQVLVLDAGKVVEHGEPAVLAANANSRFNRLFRESRERARAAAAAD